MRDAWCQRRDGGRAVPSISADLSAQPTASVSVGLTDLAPGDSIEEIIARADAALRSARRARPTSERNEVPQAHFAVSSKEVAPNPVSRETLTKEQAAVIERARRADAAYYEAWKSR